MTKDQVLQRIDELIRSCKLPHEQRPDSQMLLNGALTLMSAVYGSGGNQVKRLLERRKEIEKGEKTARSYHYAVARAIEGALENLRQEVEAGLLSAVERRVTSDVLSDFVQLAREALAQSGDKPKDVAAVLAGAAFEDTIRRIAREQAGIIGQDKLADVIIRLKDAGVLVAPQLGIAQSFLNFRNHALHGRWEAIDRASVEGVLAFVQELLLKRFAE